MSEPWKQFRPQLSLYEALEKPGGVSVDTALKRAENAMEAYRVQANSATAQRVQQLEIIAKSRSEEGASMIYDISTYILDIAGLFQPPLCRAAQSLCELVHRMNAAERWDWPSIDVHISAMRLLMGRREDKEPADMSILLGLSAVVAKYPDPSAAEAVAPPSADRAYQS